MALPVDSPQKLTDRKRAAVLEAALSAFQDKGFGNVSMDKIASLASVSKRTVYNHFESKDALFEAMIQEMVERADVLPELPYQQGTSIKKQLRAIGLQICNSVSDPSFQSLARVVMGRAINEPKFAEVLQAATSELDDKLTNWLKEAKADKQLKTKSPALAAEFFLGLLLSHSFWPHLLHFKKRMHEQPTRTYVNQCVDIFLASHGN